MSGIRNPRAIVDLPPATPIDEWHYQISYLIALGVLVVCGVGDWFRFGLVRVGDHARSFWD